MAFIKPFKALRPETAAAHVIASVPYDVIDRKEATALAEGNPLSFLRVTRAEIELPEDINPYSPEVYDKAGSNLERLRNNAPLIEEDTEYFYLYRLEMGSSSQVGIAAVFSVDDYEKDVILKHEKTRKVKEDDRTNHILNTKSQTGPVFLTYRGMDDINKIVERIQKSEKPIYDFKSADNVKHTLWQVPVEYNSDVISQVKEVKNIYIADGHHRAASASRVRRLLIDSNPSHAGTEEYNFFLGVLFPAEQLRIFPYNRTVTDLNNLTAEEFLHKVKLNFSVEPTKLQSPEREKNICMYLGRKWYVLEPLSHVKPGKSVSENLDVSILQNFLLNPVLGIDDPRTNNRIDFIGGIRGTEELMKLVDTQKAAVAFSMHPISVNDLIHISDAGEIMPPKSTWFEPKLRDGLLIHLI